MAMFFSPALAISGKLKRLFEHYLFFQINNDLRLFHCAAGTLIVVYGITFLDTADKPRDVGFGAHT